MAEEMETAGEGQIRALVCFAGNPVLSTPNGARLARAIGKLEFRVSIDPYLNETSLLADLVLPPAHALETGNFDLLLLPTAVRNFVKASAPVLARPEGARDDWEIASELGLRLAAPRFLHRPLRKLLANLPDRVADQLLKPLSLEQLYAKPDGIDLGPLRPCREKKVRGPVRLAPQAFVDDVPRLEHWLDEPAPDLVLIGRRDLRTNNSWMNDNVPSLAKGPDRALVWMNPADAARHGLDGSVELTSSAGTLVAGVKATPDLMPGVVSLAHGFGRANVNALTDDRRVDGILGDSILNGVPVRAAAAPPPLPSGKPPAR
jgi:anaerobic selenocysteine-containing dehydrogenase